MSKMLAHGDMPLAWQAKSEGSEIRLIGLETISFR